MDEFLTSLVSTILGGAIVLVIGVRLALRRFYTERWWDRKAEAYTNLIEAVFSLGNALDPHHVHPDDVGEAGLVYYSGPDPKGRRKAAAEAEIEKAMAMGDFLFSLETIRVLVTMRSELFRIQTRHLTEQLPHSSLGRAQALVVRDALRDLKSVAARDLQYRRPPARVRLGHSSDEPARKLADTLTRTGPKSPN